MIGQTISHTVHHLKAICTRLGFWVVSTFAVLTLLELVSWGLWSICGWLQPDYYENAQKSPAYGSASWVAEYYREESAWWKQRGGIGEYVPFRLWGVREWHGKYINTDASELGIWRRTDRPTHAGCTNRSAWTVWMFGGSTVFGSAVPDWATVPSYLSKILNQAGRGCALVTNFGVEGYVSTQELLLLIEKLKEGYRPDVVIFYDGINDAYNGMYSLDPRRAHYWADVIKARVEGTLRGRLDFLEQTHPVLVVRLILGKLRRGASPVATPSQAAATLDNYEANMRIVRALSTAYKFNFYCFFQPAIVYGHKPLVAYEQSIRQGKGYGGTGERAFHMLYQEVERRSVNANFVNLGDLFDSVAKPLYVDPAHLGPYGNELVANAIAKYIDDHPGGLERAR
jgi:lysophospholipase L1-like esterase